MKELLDLYDRIKEEKDLRKRHELVRRAVRLTMREGPFHLGTVARLPHIVIVSDRFHNVPISGPPLGPWAIVSPAITFPEQYFIREAER